MLYFQPVNKYFSGIIWLCLLLPTIVKAQQNGDVLETGTLSNDRFVEKIHWAGTEQNYVLISYPKNYDPKNLYHINFWFPGTAGIPGPGIENENDQYIGILVSYLTAPYATNQENAIRHWAYCNEIEKTFQKRKPTKIGQRVVSGVSKGGWMAFFMSLESPKGLDGTVIIAAGRETSAEKAPDMQRSNLSVMVATGETDPNYPYAQLADPFFKKAKLRDYTYEEWLGEGHISTISPRVQEWLNVMAKRSEPKEVFVKYCEAESSATWEKIKKLPNEVDQYKAARLLINSPAMLHVTPEFRAKLADWGKDLASKDKVKAWLSEYAKLREILKIELKQYETRNLEVDTMTKIENKYQQLAETAQHEDIRTRAAYAYVRNRKVVTMLGLQKESKKDPAFVLLEDQFNDLHEQMKKMTGNDEDLISRYKKAYMDVRGEHTKLLMDSFYKVEWQKKFTLDAKMEQLLKKPTEKYPLSTAYSGVGY